MWKNKKQPYQLLLVYFLSDFLQLMNIFLCFVHLRFLFLVKLSNIGSFKHQGAAYHLIKLLDFGTNIQCCAFKHFRAGGMGGRRVSSSRWTRLQLWTCSTCVLFVSLGMKSSRNKASDRLTIGAQDLKETPESLSVSSRATLNVTGALRLKADSRQNLSHVPTRRSLRDSRPRSAPRLHIRFPHGRLIYLNSQHSWLTSGTADWLKWLEAGGVVQLCEEQLPRGETVRPHNLTPTTGVIFEWTVILSHDFY